MHLLTQFYGIPSQISNIYHKLQMSTFKYFLKIAMMYAQQNIHGSVTGLAIEVYCQQGYILKVSILPNCSVSVKETGNKDDLS